jgi:hypothetical protein
MNSEPGSSVGIATGYGLEGPGIESCDITHQSQCHTRRMDMVPGVRHLAKAVPCGCNVDNSPFCVLEAEETACTVS